MLEMLSYTFMQRALIAGAIIGIIAPLIGVHLVLRRMSLIGDSLSHVALSGVAIGMITGQAPIITAFVATSLAALFIEWLKKHFTHYAELALAIIMSAGMGLAVVLISAARSFNAQLNSYLFGSISTVSYIDIVMVTLLGIVIVIATTVLRRELFFITLDETSARLSGVPVGKVNTIFAVLVAAMITISMRIVGILLVSSLIVLPVATAMRIAKSFKQTMVFAILFAETAIVIGMILSYYYELASGGTIVLLSVAQLIVVLIYKRILKK